MITAENISKSYGEKQVIDNLSFEIPDGGKAFVTGESGAGKTTLLRLISGIEKPDAGRLYGYDREDIAYAFQEARLFPWESAIDNVTAPVGRKYAKEAEELLGALGLGDDLSKLPGELSGGMRQRVSLARALLYDRKILLLDEPFSSLDGEMKKRAAALIREKSAEKTVLLVSHSPEDAELVFGGREFVEIKILK